MQIGIGLGLGAHMAAGRGGGYVGPYDAIPNIAALYGLRRLRSAYTGPLIRLRRSSDNQGADFGALANGDLDVAAIAAWLGGSDGYITVLYDQSGNGRDAAMGTAASQPLFVASGLNGRPVMRFDGVNDALKVTFASPYYTTNMSISIRFANAVSGKLYGRGINGNQENWMQPVGGGNRTYKNGGGGNKVVLGNVIVGVMGMAGAYGYLNGAQEVDGMATTSEVRVAYYIGAMLNHSDAIETPFSGDIHEHVFAMTTYTAQQMADINTIMGAY